MSLQHLKLQSKHRCLNLLSRSCFWNKHHQKCSMSKGWKAKELKSLWELVNLKRPR